MPRGKRLRTIYAPEFGVILRKISADADSLSMIDRFSVTVVLKFHISETTT